MVKKTPVSHLKGVGCPKCKPSPSTVYQERDTAWFVTNARAVHGDKYEYDSAVYVGRHSKLVVTCPVHGIFKQEAGKHLGGNGCPSCAGRQPALAQMLADVRAKAKDVNDFTLTEYLTPNGAVHIIYRGAIYRSNWHKPKYYYASSQVDGRHVRRALHRTIWQDYHGRPIPKGYHVHHKDENPLNNSPENLEAKPGGEHLREHLLKRMQNSEYTAKLHTQLKEAQSLAPVWHNSSVGKAWHSAHSKVMWATKVLVKMQCTLCGKDFKTLNPKIAKFCSNKCYQKLRDKSKVGYQARNCTFCGKSYHTRKNSKSKTCSASCSAQQRENKRRLRNSNLLVS